MNQNPLLLVAVLAGGLYFAKLWIDDYRAAEAGHPNPRGLPGAVPAPIRALILSALGAAVLLGAETWGEIALGISGEQSKISVLFGAYTLVAALIEEIIFRGFIVVTNRGAKVKWLAVFGASVLFAALHPFLWTTDGGFAWTFNTKGWFSTAMVFSNSLWFYTMRFSRLNPTESLLPCFAGHFTKNLGVLVIKAAQGFVVGWF